MRPDGPTIKAIRTRRKLSLRELEAQTGLNRGYLSRLENGLVQHAGDEQVRRVADSLRVPEDLIADEETTP